MIVPSSDRSRTTAPTNFRASSAISTFATIATAKNSTSAGDERDGEGGSRNDDAGNSRGVCV